LIDTQFLCSTYNLSTKLCINPTIIRWIIQEKYDTKVSS